MGCCATVSGKASIGPKNTIEVSPQQFVGESKRHFSAEYKIGKMLGKGSHEVYLCAHKETSLARAVEIVSKENLSEDLESFMKEICLLKKVDHPNIVRLFEVFEDSKRFFVVYELLTGKELLDHIAEKKRFTEVDAAKIMKQILRGVAHLHSINIVHRDIKPKNLIYESPEKKALLKIVDFSTTECIEKGKKMKSITGTPYYIAPEVLRGSYNEKCDVWSCGVVMYTLLSGTFPFYAHKKDDLLEKIRRGEYTMKGSLWESVSDSGKDLIKNMLLFDQDKRFSASQAYSHKWIKEYGDETVRKTEKEDILGALKKFGAHNKLQQAALTCMASQMSTKAEKEKLAQVFLSLDKSGTGKLSKNDLLIGFREVYGDLINVEEEVEKIISNIDSNKSGVIDYTEFVVATIDKKSLLSKERLIAAFKMFDKDGSGLISLDEIKAVLSGNEKVSSEKWKDVIQEVDKENKGEVSLDSFITMMEKLLNAS